MIPSKEEINEIIIDIAKFRIQRRIGDLTPYERLKIFFSQPMILNGVSFSPRFIQLLKTNFSIEEINQTILGDNPTPPDYSVPYTISKNNPKFDDFTYLFTKGKFDSFAIYINIVAENYFNNEVTNVLNFINTYSSKLPPSELFKILTEEFEKPLPTK